jgi:hypothetical protein
MARRNRIYIAIIADMVKSRELPSAQRGPVQKHFADLIRALNAEYRKGIAARFVITLGDEFQGLLNTSTLTPDLIWKLEESFPDRELRVGVGLGTLDTPLQKVAINIDGPAFHAARAAIEIAKKNNLLGGVFVGFGQINDALNGIARMLWFHRSNWTSSQRTITGLLRTGMSQSEIAEHLRIKRQVVSKQVSASGSVIYIGAEKAWDIIFRDYVDPLIRKK